MSSIRFRLVRILGNGERACLCPWHDDRRESLLINLEKDKAICFAGCYKGSARGAVKKLLGFVPRDLETAFEWTTTSPTRIPRALPYKTMGGNGLEYLYGRGFVPATLEAYEAGFDGARNCVFLPVRKRDGSLQGTIYRQVDSNAVPKYLYSPGFRVSRCLFGTPVFEPIPAPFVYVVEGPLDCMWMWQCEYKSTVALLGCNLSETQARLLRRLGSTVVLCLDNDLPGKAATSHIGSVLAAQGLTVYVIQHLEGKKDVQECSAEELAEVIKQPVPFLRWKLAEKTP